MQQPSMPAAAVEANTDRASVVPTSVSHPSATTATCVTCGKPVALQVSNYCLTHQERFGGQIYCYDHQKLVRRQSEKATKTVHVS